MSVSKIAESLSAKLTFLLQCLCRSSIVNMAGRLMKPRRCHYGDRPQCTQAGAFSGLCTPVSQRFSRPVSPAEQAPVTGHFPLLRL
jgi:hypothetical protein